jgi:FOG: EAL domain
MRYTSSQWLAFGGLVAANAIAVVLLVIVTDVGALVVVAYAVAIPVLFRLAIIASSALHLGMMVQAVRVWRAMRRREIVMYFQPLVSLAPGTIYGAEALARWEHPVRGTLPPSEWLPATEQFRWLEKRFCRYTLNAACRQAWAWRKAGKDLRLCVNVSPRCFADRRLVAEVRARLDEWKLPPSAIEIEVTETALLSGETDAVAAELSEMGITLALDDFGTGHASMDRLVRLPFSTLKIDRSFVSEMISDDRKRAVVRSACSLGHSLSVTLIAEGVETVAVRDALSRLGCDVGQGYLFSRPLPPDEFNEWLEDNQVDSLYLATSLAPPERRAILRRQDDRGRPEPRSPIAA